MTGGGLCNVRIKSVEPNWGKLEAHLYRLAK